MSCVLFLKTFSLIEVLTAEIMQIDTAILSIAGVCHMKLLIVFIIRCVESL